MRWEQEEELIRQTGDGHMKKVYKIVACIAGAAAVICAVVGIRHCLQEQGAGAGYEEIRGEVKADTSAGDTEAASGKEADPPVEIPIDFESLQERNPDVYAWITVPGTRIDYPVLQNPDDNSYYLTHTIDGEVKTEGAIFTENYNHTDMEDPNTVIYGHDMKNGSMFQNLLNYQDRGFFEENREVIIYTPDAVRHYKIFAAYLYDDRHLLQSFNFYNTDVFRQYLDRIFSIRDMNACIDTSTDVDTDDKIVTLSTCYGSQSDRRYLVQAVLVTIEK